MLIMGTLLRELVKSSLNTHLGIFHNKFTVDYAYNNELIFI